MMTDVLPEIGSYAKNQIGYMSFLYCTNSFLKRFLLFLIMCISAYMYMHEYSCLWKPEEG